MTKHYALSAAKRDRAGKGIARTLRRDNNIPAVIYGDKKEPLIISLPLKEITLEYLKGHMFTTLCDITVDGTKQLVLVRDVQRHPVSDKIEHVDFLRVTEKTKLTVAVPVHFINYDASPAAKSKAVLNIVRHEVDLVCLAQAIPESIEVDLSTFEIGDAVKISAAKLPAGTTPTITDRDFTLATLAAPRAVVEEAPVAAEVDAAAPAADAKAEEGKKAE
jgi:large subunit ribosomal protein L25